MDRSLEDAIRDLDSNVDSHRVDSMAQLYQLEPDCADVVVVPSRLTGAARHLVPCATIVANDELPSRALARYHRGEAWLYQHHVGVAPTQSQLQVWACSQLTFWNDHDVSIVALKSSSAPLSPPDTLVAYVGDADSDAFVRRVKTDDAWRTTKRLYLPMQSTAAPAAPFPLGQLSSLIRQDRMQIARALFAVRRQGVVLFDATHRGDMRQVYKLRILASAFALEVKTQGENIVVTRRARQPSIEPLPVPREISLSSRPVARAAGQAARTQESGSVPQRKPPTESQTMTVSKKAGIHRNWRELANEERGSQDGGLFDTQELPVVSFERRR